MRQSTNTAGKGALPIGLCLIVALWISCLGTLIVVYLLINRLPSLVLSRGLTRVQSAVVQMMFNIGGGVGAIAIASLRDRIGRRRTVAGMYVGIVVALAALLGASGGASMAWGGLLADQLLAIGQGASMLLSANIPLIAVAAIAAWLVVAKSAPRFTPAAVQ